MKINSDASKREKEANKPPSEGPLSKANYDRFADSIKETQARLGARNIAKINEEELFSNVIKEET
jgi:hypothetical protein